MRIKAELWKIVLEYYKEMDKTYHKKQPIGLCTVMHYLCYQDKITEVEWRYLLDIISTYRTKKKWTFEVSGIKSMHIRFPYVWNPLNRQARYNFINKQIKTNEKQS